MATATVLPALQALGSESMSSDESRPVFIRSNSSFLRVSDLELDSERTSCCADLVEDDIHPNYHHAAINPPPGVETNEKEKWIALSDGTGAHAPIAPIALDRLHNFALSTTYNESMWAADKKTAKLIKKASSDSWMHQTFTAGVIKLPEGTDEGLDILTWNGSFKHEFYGNDLPAIRVAAIINVAPKDLLDLLVDSSRTKEYNKMSLGREDLVVFQDDLEHEGPFGRSVTKITRSASKPPLIRKHMVFESCFHARELEDGSGYMIASRAVHHPEDENTPKNVIQSEMLMGTNLIRKIEGCENKCIMINVNHIRSPMVPMMIAKKVGVAAAVGFINDVRGAC